VYHATSNKNSEKILQFGFDLDLSGQGTILAFKMRGDKIIDDKFVMEKEEMLEHSVINTRRNYAECVGYGDNLLRMTLKSDIKLLDVKKIPTNLRGHGWRKIFSFAKANGCDGISSNGYIMIFGNKKIEKIEQVKNGDDEFDDFMDLFTAYNNKLDSYKNYKRSGFYTKL
ncbi:MAG: hypothetical protein ACREAR_02925, partial [Nitrosotalea sp.]